MKHIHSLSSAIALGSLAWAHCSFAAADTGEDVAAAFGQREAVTDISLSPSGEKVAFVQPMGPRGYVVMVADYSGTPSIKPVLTVEGQGESLGNCSWPTNEQVICTMYLRDKSSGSLGSFSRLVVASLDGSPPKVITAREGARAMDVAQYGGEVIDWYGARPGEVLILRQFVPENTTGSRVAQTGEGLGVESVDVVTQKRSIAERPVREAIDFISDGRGEIRIMGINPTGAGGYDKTFIDYSYRRKGERSWHGLGRVTINPSGALGGFYPRAIDPELDVVYGFDLKDGYSALYSQKLDGSGTREVVVAKPGIDVDGLVRIGRSNRVVGVSYSTDYRRVEFFDPELAALRKALGKALPGDPLVSFVDSSEDESKLLMYVGSDIDPGRYYLFDKSSSKLEEVLPLRPAMANRTLAEMKPVQFPAADGTMIPGYLTIPPGSSGKNLPAIVMPHGGPSSRDEWGFDWLVQFYAARGYAVLQPNFRGSAGFGEAWFQKNGFQSWRTAVGDVDDAGRWLVSSGVADKEKLAIVGWSYGGYAALQSGVLDPGLYKAIVAIAPVTDLDLMRQSRINYTDFQIVNQMIGNGPHVSEGSPANNAGKFQVPVLMFHGDWDMNVDINQSQRMESRLRSAGKNVELVTFQGLSHSLTDSQARKQMLSRSDAFLRSAMGLPKQ